MSTWKIHRVLSIAVVVIALCVAAEPARACATCNLDGGGGQGLMLFFMLSVPLLALIVGISVVRRLLSRMEAS
jgi:hypothetical protein